MNNFEIEKLYKVISTEDTNFFSIDGLDSRYVINISGLIWDTKNRRYIFPVVSNGKLKIELYLNNKRTFILLSRIYLMAFRPMNISLDSYLHKLEVIVYDETKQLPDLRNLNWRLPEGGIECLKFPGYYSIVGNKNIVVSKDYKFKNYISGYDLKILYSKNKFRYPTISNRSTSEIKDNLNTDFVHRLLALAFLQIPLFKKDLFVNHKNGIKNDFLINNLEFVNHVTNIKHAFETGLRDDNIKVIAFNLITKEKRIFNSMNDCAKSLNTKTGLISRAIDFYHKSKYIKIKPWLILRENDSVPRLEIKLLENVLPNEKLFYRVFDVISNIEKFVFGKRDLYKIVKVKNGRNLIDSIKVSYKPFEIGNYKIFPIRSDLVSSEIKKIKPKQSYGSKPPIPIRVTNLITNVVYEYLSTEIFANQIGAKKKTIQRRALYNSGIWNNFKIEYLKN